jgi:TonB family protein
MRRFFTAFSILVCTALACAAQYRTRDYSDLTDSETVKAMRAHVGFLASAALEGRAAGSDGELEAADYVRDVFEAYGLDLLSGPDGDMFGIRRDNGDTLVSRNVTGVIQGYDKSLRDRYIVIGARLDNIGTRTINVDGEPLTRIYNGANGNASGVAMMLELARMLKVNSVMLKRSVVFVAFGSSLESHIGSWYFLNRSFEGADRIDGMINLDIVGKGKGFYAYTSSNADMNRIVNRINSSLQPIKPELTTAEPVDSDHRMFYASEIPSVLFTTGIYPEYGTDRDTPSILQFDDMERELEYIYNFSMELVNGAAPAFRPGEGPGVADTPSGAVPYYECDVLPSFLGSTDPKVFLEKWVYAYLKYPQEAVRNGIQGRVLVDFVIDEKGKVKDVKVLKGVDPLLDAEAVKVVGASPDWRPARIQGKKVRSEMSIYVEFKLERRKNR